MRNDFKVLIMALLFMLAYVLLGLWMMSIEAPRCDINNTYDCLTTMPRWIK